MGPLLPPAAAINNCRLYANHARNSNFQRIAHTQELVVPRRGGSGARALAAGLQCRFNPWIVVADIYIELKALEAIRNIGSQGVVVGGSGGRNNSIGADSFTISRCACRRGGHIGEAEGWGKSIEPCFCVFKSCGNIIRFHGGRIDRAIGPHTIYILLHLRSHEAHALGAEAAHFHGVVEGEEGRENREGDKPKITPANSTSIIE